MTTTITAHLLTDVASLEQLISLFTLRTIGARDLMVDASGTLGFFYGHPGDRRTQRMQVQAVGPDAYVVQAGYIAPRTRIWVVEETRQASRADLRDVVRELA